MDLYLVQHAEAKSKEEDLERSLADVGSENAERMAAWAARAGVRVEQIRHSGKKRAEETAEILAAALSPGQVVAVEGLKPNDDVYPVAEELSVEERAVMLVGHLPHLARLASLLLCGKPEFPLVRFQNAGIVHLSRDEETWSLRWVVTPDLVEG